MATFRQFIRKLRLPHRSICTTRVEVETWKSDEKGKAVHRDCYARSVGLKQITTESLATLGGTILVTIENAGRIICCPPRRTYEATFRAP
jgi:hypothetical protein